jgi:type II restriction enzyme
MDWTADLLKAWKADPSSTYNSWFLWEERLKNFRSIRRGIQTVVDEIKSDTFGNAYRGSSLETVMGSIAEQRQMFKGADHAFLWKPKLRIPDIYEDRENQLAFGRFLDACLCCNTEEQIIRVVHELDHRKIKGLGPAAANLMYFLHPTLMPPFNTAIVNGFNEVFGARVKLGRWTEYLAMREGMIRFNNTHRQLLSNDFGALAGFLFDVGSGRYAVPSKEQITLEQWREDLIAAHNASAAATKSAELARNADLTHTQIQGWLRDLGISLGFSVWIASNDVRRPYDGGVLGDGCLTALPGELAHQPDGSIKLIDVLWFNFDKSLAAAFEVEHSTSIYSGIVRMLDLALGSDAALARNFFLVAPDDREEEVRAQFLRPAFSRVNDLDLRYLPYSQLKMHRESMARFGSGLKAVLSVARPLGGPK